ncbi:MAG: hypothetical protein AAFX87_25430 [Bacteroidota bacterium]
MKKIIFFATAWLLTGALSAQNSRQLKQFEVDEARQGVAVSEDYFFVINNSAITKHQKVDGKKVGVWEGSDKGVVHLNSGVIIDGKLYCANSNYPESPMASSIEVFDPESMTHIDSHSFGIYVGSATWIDRYQGHWYVAFAHYTGRGSTEGKDNNWTTLIKFDEHWQRMESWLFPKALIEKFAGRSNSGGFIDANGLIYCTGHDAPELYVLKLPEIGYTLNWTDTIPINIHGQGIAIDKSLKRKTIYGIIKSDNTVTITQID